MTPASILNRTSLRYFDLHTARGATIGLAGEVIQLIPISIHAPARGATPGCFLPSSPPGISIHAPARGATSSCWIVWDKQNGISIHAPARGATDQPNRQARVTGDFNPRSREGSDLLEQIKILAVKISIHAPARGATAVGCNTTIPSLGFQSTLPRGERRFLSRSLSLVCPDFNPRSREGSDC